MNVSWSGRRIVAIVATMQVALPSAEVIDLPVDLVSSTLLTADAPQIGHSISYKQPPLCWTGPQPLSPRVVLAQCTMYTPSGPRGR